MIDLKISHGLRNRSSIQWASMLALLPPLRCREWILEVRHTDTCHQLISRHNCTRKSQVHKKEPSGDRTLAVLLIVSYRWTYAAKSNLSLGANALKVNLYKILCASPLKIICRSPRGLSCVLKTVQFLQPFIPRTTTLPLAFPLDTSTRSFLIPPFIRTSVMRQDSSAKCITIFV